MLVKMQTNGNGGGASASGEFTIPYASGGGSISIDTGIKNLKRFCAMGQIMSIDRRNTIAWDTDWKSGNNDYYVSCSPTSASAGNVAYDVVGTSKQMCFYIESVDTATGVVVLHGGTKAQYEQGSGYWFAE